MTAERRDDGFNRCVYEKCGRILLTDKTLCSEHEEKLKKAREGVNI
jgi:hypothetical protein